MVHLMKYMDAKHEAILTLDYSYCNSIVQALYYSAPFRENVVRYPPHSPHDTPNGNALPKISVPIRQSNGAISSPTKPKGVSASEALKRRAAVAPAPPGGPMRPEDKPDSPEYKKKHAMMNGPILELTYESASSYGMEESTFTALKDIFMALIANPSRTGVVSPQRFLEIFKRENEMFRTSMHQDAHEFYGLVLNAVISNVEDNAKRLRELEPPRQDTGLAQSTISAMTSAANAMGLAGGARSPGTGWVHDIFEGVLTSETKCLTCETASQRDETFLDLSIDLEQHSSVTSCLRKFSAEEMLCERNKFHCDNCGGLQEAEKRMKIKKLPKILALHLKRFKYTEDMTRLQKLFHRVVYQDHLRMFNTTDDAEDPDRLYELYAVVVHIGGNAYHGHYVSVIKTQDRGWLLFDDEMVEPVDKHYVKNFFGDKPGQACAYVLFYQETSLEAVRKEQEAEGMAEAEFAHEEAGIALGTSIPNGGTHPSSVSKPVSIPSTPIDDRETFASLDHAISIPLSPTTPSQPFSASYGASPTIAMPNVKKVDTKSKEEKEREKKEAKEAEKVKKKEEKEQAKANEKRRKEAESGRKEYQKQQAEQMRQVLAASRSTAAEEEDKRKKEGELATIPEKNSKESKKEVGTNGNGIFNGETNTLGRLSLTRSHKGSKSMSRKSFGFLSGRSASVSGPSTGGIEGSDTLLEGNESSQIQTPETNSKPPKERFSFSLGRKKSSLQ
jgi:ubiquitin carboxyl-terminal hydrolase 9/13